jgi:hypothetical protein
VKTADKAGDKARAEFRERSKPDEISAKLKLLTAYFKAELPEKDTDAVRSDIYRVLFTYDPGLGVNAVE